MDVPLDQSCQNPEFIDSEIPLASAVTTVLLLQEIHTHCADLVIVGGQQVCHSDYFLSSHKIARKHVITQSKS